MAQSPRRGEPGSRATSFPASTAPGPGVDASGRAVVDPTRNVLDLVDAAVQRQDDLREMESAHATEIRKLNDTHVHEILALRAEQWEKLREAEANRLDAIRQVDRDTVARAADVQTTAASTLANQVATSADQVRLNLDAKTAPILEAIASLQRAQYETAGGKAQVVDARDMSGSRGLWVGIAVAAFVGFNGLLLTAVGIVITIIIFKR